MEYDEQTLQNAATAAFIGGYGSAPWISRRFAELTIDNLLNGLKRLPPDKLEREVCGLKAWYEAPGSALDFNNLQKTLDEMPTWRSVWNEDLAGQNAWNAAIALFLLQNIEQSSDSVYMDPERVNRGISHNYMALRNAYKAHREVNKELTEEVRQKACEAAINDVKRRCTEANIDFGHPTDVLTNRMEEAKSHVAVKQAFFEENSFTKQQADSHVQRYEQEKLTSSQSPHTQGR